MEVIHIYSPYNLILLSHSIYINKPGHTRDISSSKAGFLHPITQARLPNTSRRQQTPPSLKRCIAFLRIYFRLCALTAYQMKENNPVA